MSHFNVLQSWAKDEAIARREVIANGGEVEFGKWYSTPEFETGPDGKPALKRHF